MQFVKEIAEMNSDHIVEILAGDMLMKICELQCVRMPPILYLQKDISEKTIKEIFIEKCRI